MVPVTRASISIAQSLRTDNGIFGLQQGAVGGLGWFAGLQAFKKNTTSTSTITIIVTITIVLS